MATTFVGSGIVSSGLVVASGNILEVQSGGTASATTVSSGGLQQVDSGGLASGTVISSGGSDSVYGTDRSATIDNGGSETVSSGGSAAGTTVSSGGFLYLDRGGAATGVTIDSGGTMVISAGDAGFGITNNGTVLFQGNELTSATTFNEHGSGTGLGTVIISAGLLRLSFSGSTNSSGGPFVISGGGRLELTSAGAAVGRPIDLADINTILRIDGTTMPADVISGFVPGERWIDLTALSFSATSSVQIAAGNVLQVNNGGTVYDLQLDPLQNYAGEPLEILPDGNSGTRIGLGSATTVASGSSVSNVAVASGTFENVSGTISGATTTGGGTLVVFSGAAASGTVLNGGLEIVMGSDVGATVNSAGLVWVYSGGTASGTTVAGGVEIVLPGGTALNTNVSSGALRIEGSLESGGSVAGDAVVLVYPGGTDSGTTVSSGGVLTVSSGGTTVSSLLTGSALNSSGSFGATEFVLSGGTAIGTTLSASADLIISAGGSASGTIVDSRTGPGNGGFVNFGSASGTTVNSGGGEFVNSGGTESGATINGGGFLALSGGTAVGTTVNAEGSVFVSSGSLTSGTLILSGDSSGGAEFVRGSAINTTLDNGAQQIVRSGGAATGTVVNGGGAVEFVFSGGVASGTTVNSGGFQEVGATNSGGTSSAGGTAVSTTVNSAGVESVIAGGVASGTVVNAGGRLGVRPGGTASGAMLSGGTEYVSSGGTAQDVTFGGSSGTLELVTPTGLSGTMSDWQTGDTIDFVGTSVTSASIAGSTLTVTVSGGQAFSYQLANAQQGGVPYLKSDGAGGTDVLLNVLPVTTASNGSLKQGQSVAASTLFSASDSDGDAIAQYAVFDATSGGGHFVVGGTPMPSGVSGFYITPQQYLTTTFVAGPNGSTDHIYVAAFDSVQEGPVTSFYVSALIDPAPVITASNYQISKGQISVAASSLFTASDPDGDAVTRYAVFDATPGSGYFAVGGTPMPSGALGFYLTPQQYLATTFVPGPSGSSDHIYVAAFDGTQEGPAASFNVTAPIDSPPVVTASNVQLPKGQTTVAAPSLFTASDPDGDAVTQFAVFDATSGGGISRSTARRSPPGSRAFTSRCSNTCWRRSLSSPGRAAALTTSTWLPLTAREKARSRTSMFRHRSTPRRS
jgi:autotransporter passenger strand-loop-strand repeat protein